MKKMIHNDFSKITAIEKTWMTTRQKLYKRVAKVLLEKSRIGIATTKELSEKEYLKRWANTLSHYIVDAILEKKERINNEGG